MIKLTIKRKFSFLAAFIGGLMILVSIIGYYIAYTNLDKALEAAITSSTEAQGNKLEGWVAQKAEVAKAAANIMTQLGGQTNVSNMHSILGLATNNKDILDVTNGNENGFIMSYKDGNVTGKTNPAERPWFLAAKKQNKVIFTNAYRGADNGGSNAGKLMVSAAAPYYDANGQFKGAICEDISCKILDDVANSLKYRGQGNGIIIQHDGQILATSDSSLTSKNINANPGLKSHFQQMLSDKNGYFFVNRNGVEEVVTYTTLSTTGWIVALTVPKAFVFAPMRNLQITYAIISIIGIILIVFSCQRFASKVIHAINKLKTSSDKIASGDLSGPDIEPDDDDELGELTMANNSMKRNISDLISKMVNIADKVASSSKDLTASATQSAEASNHVAETVTSVAAGMEDQMKNIDAAKGDVERVFTDMQEVATKTQHIAEASGKTAEAAQKGETLMKEAMVRMGKLETSVMDSSKVVQKLGENSKQIGQIVDTIAAISDQTNLLALNAAIEAARAGEHGKGFAVVAEEVRKLAAESQNSAEEIKNRISVIQEDTIKAVQVMQDGTVEVQSGTEAIRNVGTQFTSIMGMVNNIKSQMDNINDSVQSVSQGAKNIVTAVDSIDKVSRQAAEQTQSISAATEEQSASTEEIASASHALATMSVELKESTNKFKIE